MDRYDVAEELVQRIREDWKRNTTYPVAVAAEWIEEALAKIDAEWRQAIEEAARAMHPELRSMMSRSEAARIVRALLGVVHDDGAEQ